MKQPTDKKIKLSPKQKEVIRLMREGWFIETSVFFKNTCTLENETNINTLHFTTFDKLLKYYLIYDTSYGIQTQRRKYYLSKLGKTIDIS